MFTIITPISPEKIQLPPGAVMRLPGSWQDYQAISQQLDDRASLRLKYRPSKIFLMAHLPEHGRKVPEVWLLKGDKLSIYHFQNEQYTIKITSQYFINIKVLDIMTECLKNAYECNTSTAKSFES
jgi:hypothetical protein